MEFAVIFKHPKENPPACAERILLAAIFDREELSSFGVPDDSDEMNESHLGQDEFTKWRKLMLDPSYLSDFYCNHIEFFRQSFWRGIDEERFVTDAIASSPRIFRELGRSLKEDGLEKLFQPLDSEDECKADYTAIRVKSKFGRIMNRFVFRIYAIKIDTGCYVITGGAIKIDKDMGKAPNTRVELEKLNYVHDAVHEEGLTDKISFLDFVFE